MQRQLMKVMEMKVRTSTLAPCHPSFPSGAAPFCSLLALSLPLGAAAPSLLCSRPARPLSFSGCSCLLCVSPPAPRHSPTLAFSAALLQTVGIYDDAGAESEMKKIKSDFEDGRWA